MGKRKNKARFGKFGKNREISMQSLDTSTEISYNPLVTITMTNGDIIKAELYPQVAPNTVNNFIYLIKIGFYNNKNFHRVIPNFMIQGGCPDGTGMGGPGYCIKGEFSANGFENNLVHERGVLSMARAQNKDSAGSQFFIMHQNSSHLDGLYASFGRVIEGIEVVDKIANVDRDMSDKPLTAQTIGTVNIDEKGIDYSEPEKLI